MYNRDILKQIFYIEDERLNEYDYNDCIYDLSTALFDCSHDNILKADFLKQIRSEFGKKVCIDVLEGFENGQHDT